MEWPPLPGPGAYPVPLDVLPFYVLVALFGLFVAMLVWLRRSHPRSRRAFEGYLEAARVDIGFLAVAIVGVALLHFAYPTTNRTGWAVYEAIMGGYWLAFAIPIVTVASSVQSRSRGTIPWRTPAIGLAFVLFVLFVAAAYYGV